MEKNSDLLNNLRVEMEDARNGIGKTIDEVKNVCIYLDDILSTIEGGLDVLEIKNMKAPDLTILPKDNRLFSKLIVDLYSKGIIFHYNDLVSNINKKLGGYIFEGKLIMQNTDDIREMIEGTGIVIKNINEFRKYRSQIKEIIAFEDNYKNIIKDQINISPTSFMSKSINVPEQNPIFIYNANESKINFIKNSKPIIFDDLTELSMQLFVYFLNNINIPISEEIIEKEFERFLKKGEYIRSERATYMAINKLCNKLKKVTGEKFLNRKRERHENIWTFNI